MENGISINDETYSQIHYVDSACVRSPTKALLRPYHEVYPNANVQVYYRGSSREGKPPKPSEGYIKSVYGLRGDEWTGTSADVRTIINQRSSRIGSMREQRVNDFLRDQEEAGLAFGWACFFVLVEAGLCRNRCNSAIYWYTSRMYDATKGG